MSSLPLITPLNSPDVDYSKSDWGLSSPRASCVIPDTIPVSAYSVHHHHQQPSLHPSTPITRKTNKTNLPFKMDDIKYQY